MVQRQRNSCRSVEYWSSGPRDGADVGVCKTKMTVSSVVGGDSSARYGGVWPRSNLNTRIVPSHSPLNPPMSNVLQSYLSLTALPSQPFFHFFLCPSILPFTSFRWEILTQIQFREEFELSGIGENLFKGNIFATGCHSEIFILMSQRHQVRVCSVDRRECG